MSTPILIFLVTYFLIAAQRVPGLHLNRPAAALLGAVAMVLFGGLPLREAYAAVDLDVLVFLLGVMLLVAHLELGGFFEQAAAWLLTHAHTPRRLLVYLTVGSGLLSAFFVNDTVCLVLVPVVLAALGPLDVRPAPYLLGLGMGSNVGSLLTFTGNPQNMLVGLWSGIPFARFSLQMLPVVAGGLAITCLVLLKIYREELSPPLVRDAIPPVAPADGRMVGTALALFAGCVAAWVAGASLPLAAIAAGALMLALGGRNPGDALARVEWSLLLFFAALFVVMQGLERSGIVDRINHDGLAWMSPDNRWSTATAVSGVMLVLSNLISNVPAVILWRSVVPALPEPRFVWSVMAMSATLAGNMLLIGSMANLIVAERAEARGVKLGYWEFARAGVPVTLLTIGWGIVVLVLTT